MKISLLYNNRSLFVEVNAIKSRSLTHPHTLSAATLEKWSLRGGGGVLSAFPSRHASFQSNLQLLPQRWRLQHCGNNRLHTESFFSGAKSSWTIVSDVNVQKKLSPAVIGLKPVNLGEAGRLGQPELLGAGCFCRANRISRPTWRHFFCCIRDDLSVTSGR